MFALAKILAAAALWSTIGVVATLGGDPVWLAFIRSVVAAVASLLLGAPLSRGALLPGLLLGGLFSAYPLAALYAGVGPAAYLLYTAPLWTAAALSLKGERPRMREAAGVALVLAAVALFLSASATGEISLIGVATGLASGLFYGLYIASARVLAAGGRQREASLGAIAYTPVVTGPLAAAYFAWFGKPPTLVTAAAGAYLGVFATLVPYVLFASAVREVGGTRASVVATAEPVLAAVWGFIFFGQAPGAATLLAYVLITVATVLASGATDK
ncbi:MAG: EamA family transporter [Pyrobaculum sp.]